jgi:fibronectin-binding autotransporter adhesin
MRNALKICLVFVVFSLGMSDALGQTNYYWNGTSSVTSTSSWGTSLNGTGTNPTNFTANNQIFNFQSTQSATPTGIWTVSGTVSSIKMLSGSTFTSGAFNHSISRLDMDAGSLYDFNHTSYSGTTFGTLDPASVFRYSGTSGLRTSGITYGIFEYNSSSAFSLSSSSQMTATGVLRVVGGGELRLTANTNATHNFGGIEVSASRNLNLTSGTGNSVSNITGGFANSGNINRTGTGTATLNFTGSNVSDIKWGALNAGISFTVNVGASRDLTFMDAFTVASGGILTLTNNGILRVGNGNASGAIQQAITNNGQLYFNRLDNVTQGGIISGTGSLTKQAAGTLTLDKANTYSGTTTVAAGNLTLGSSGSISSSPTITVATGATVDVNSVSGGFSLLNGQILQGSGSVIGSTTLVSGATIRGDSGAGVGTALSTGNVIVNSGGIIFANLAGNGTSSKLSVGASTLDLKTGSVLKLDGVAGFSPVSGHTWTIAELTSGNLQLNTANVSDGFQFGKYVEGTGNSGPVQIDVTGLPALAAGDQLILSRSTNSLILTFVTVPEPALLFGLAAGLLGVGAAVRKKFFATATGA